MMLSPFWDIPCEFHGLSTDYSYVLWCTDMEPFDAETWDILPKQFTIKLTNRNKRLNRLDVQ